MTVDLPKVYLQKCNLTIDFSAADSVLIELGLISTVSQLARRPTASQIDRVAVVRSGSKCNLVS